MPDDVPPPTKADSLNALAIVEAKLLSLPDDVPPEPVTIDLTARTVGNAALVINHAQDISTDAKMLVVFVCANVPYQGTTDLPVTSTVTAGGVPMIRSGAAYATGNAPYGRGVECFYLKNPPTGTAIPIVVNTPKPAGAAANQTSHVISVSLKNAVSIGTPGSNASNTAVSGVSASTNSTKSGLVLTGLAARSSTAFTVSTAQSKLIDSVSNTNIRVGLTSQEAANPAVSTATMATADMMAIYSLPVFNT